MNDNYLTNIEFVLLQIICQRKSISGYQINKLVAERGYRDWVNIGSTSIYAGLARLTKKKLVSSFLDTHKQGKGPPPKLFSITPAGQEKLKSTVIEALSSGEIRDSRFDLGISGMPLLDKDEIVAALGNRKNALIDHAAGIEKRYRNAGGDKLRFHIRMLYEHSLNASNREVIFVDRLIEEIS